MFEISEKEVLERLRFDNPWWEDGENSEPPFAAMPRRKYFAPFLASVEDRTISRAVVLMGPRRVGKTVMVHHAIQALLEKGVAAKSILYLSLETPLYTGLRLEKILRMFLGMFKHGRHEALFVFFDEIQYLKEWEIHLKSLVDSYRECKFVATGSAAAALRLKSQESGAGRFTDFVLPPLTFAEYLQFVGRESELIQGEPFTDRHDFIRTRYTTSNIAALNEEFQNYLNFGGYPEAVFSKTIQSNPGQFIKNDIVDKVLLRDLPSLYGISDIQELNRLFTVLAYNTGNEISLEQLSQSAGVAKNTIKRYLEYLEAAFLIRRMERIDQNAKRFKRAMCFKVYLTNPSIRAALFGHVGPDAEAMGALTETAIFSQWQHSENVTLCYARWNDGEVDIVNVSGSAQSPEWIVEVKWSDRPLQDRSLLRHCVVFYRKHSGIEMPILVTTRTKTGTASVDGVEFEFCPSALYAYMLGANILSHTAQSTR